MQLRKYWMAMVLGLVFAAAALARAEYLYKWIKDTDVNSGRVLRPTQASRVFAAPEAAALEAVRKVMTDDLYLALAEYHPTRHRQDAETVKDTVLPEEVVGQNPEVDLVDEDYRFLLEVKLKSVGNRTRVTAKASPVYRVRDLDAEAERAAGQGNENNTVDIKVQADQTSAVQVGPIYIEPLEGPLTGYQVAPLPDAADRAAKLVRSFMYFMDQRVKAGAAR